MDAEMLGIARGWDEVHNVIASDSQGATRKCLKLISGVVESRSRIDERVIRSTKGEITHALMWVKGHSGVAGNEIADRRAKVAVMKGQWDSKPSLATPAGIRSAYPLFDRAHIIDGTGTK